VRRT